MLASMTGFGKAECDLPGKRISIEIKSLNSKQLDISTRLPSIFKEKELVIRDEISRMLERGKIDCYFSIESTDSKAPSHINKEIIKHYISQLKEVADELQLGSGERLLQVAMNLPDSLMTVKEELDEKEWKTVLKTLQSALKNARNYRKREGKILEKDIRARIRFILNKLNKITPFDKARIENIRKRICQNLKNLRSEESYDPNRFEQELIYYLEKLDITEEQVRLANHCSYFMEVISSDETAGKKLGFISQEIAREMNTLGAKANDSHIQRLVVEMKDEVEKIREQLNNIL